MALSPVPFSNFFMYLVSSARVVLAKSFAKKGSLRETSPPEYESGLRCSEVTRFKTVNTLLKLKNWGLAEGTLINMPFNLKHLAKHADIDKPETFAKYMVQKQCANKRFIHIFASIQLIFGGFYGGFATFFWHARHRYAEKLHLYILGHV